MQIRSWLQFPSSFTHRSIIRREILSKKDPNAPGADGAILNYVDSFSRSRAFQMAKDADKT